MAHAHEEHCVHERMKASSYPFTSPTGSQFQPILDAIGDAQVVLIGEESHGTQEFYESRAELTKLLITQKGFNFVAVEADWPDAYKINRYAQGVGDASDLKEPFSLFERFPRWMWRNEVVLRFAMWLRGHNDGFGRQGPKVGFYGLDLYSLFSSAHAVLSFLNAVDPAAAARAKQRYSCFDRFGDDTQSYAMATSFGMSKNCQSEVARQLKELLQLSSTTAVEEDEAWCAQMNARVVRDAEEYYRKMFTDDTWNIRDQHMSNTLDDIMQHYASKLGPDKKVKAVVWAHNSHLGDASHTDMGGKRGEINLGQLTRERYGITNTFNVGFSTYTGTVTAAHEWDSPGETMNVNPALKSSYEFIMHETQQLIGNNFFLLFRANPSPQRQHLKVTTAFDDTDELLERAIGVVYKPRTERASHYFGANLPCQFDAYIHIEKSSALIPLDKGSKDWSGEPPSSPMAV